MLIVSVKEGEIIEKALKKFKNKFEKSKAVMTSETKANKIISEMISSKKSTAAQMNRLNALGVDDVTIRRRIKGKNVIPSGSFAGKNKYIVKDLSKAANITKLLEEIKIARPELTDSQAIEVFESMETLCEIMTANHLEHKILPKK